MFRSDGILAVSKRSWPTLHSSASPTAKMESVAFTVCDDGQYIGSRAMVFRILECGCEISIRSAFGSKLLSQPSAPKARRAGTRLLLGLRESVRAMVFDVIAKGTVNQNGCVPNRMSGSLRSGNGARVILTERPPKGGRAARHGVIVLLDSDAHPVDAGWLALTAEMLDEHRRLGGPQFYPPHRENKHGWSIHPHFKCVLQGRSRVPHRAAKKRAAATPARARNRPPACWMRGEA